MPQSTESKLNENDFSRQALRTSIGARPRPQQAGEIERLTNALKKTSALNVQRLDVKDLLTVQNLLNHGDTFGRWVTPIEWMASHRPTVLNIDLLRRILNFVSPNVRDLIQQSHCQPGTAEARAVRRVLDGAVLVETRYLVLLSMGPVGIGKRRFRQTLDASTIASLAYNYLPALLGIAVTKWLTLLRNESDIEHATDDIAPASFGYFSLIQSDDLKALSRDVQRAVRRESSRMKSLMERGYWSDVPALNEGPPEVTDVAGKAATPTPQKETNKHLPLPDDFVANMGTRSLWLIEQIFPNLMVIAQEIQTIWLVTARSGATANSIAYTRRRDIEKFLESFQWKDNTGKLMEAPPFALRFPKLGKTKRTRALSQPGKALRRIESDLDEDTYSFLDESNTELMLAEWPPRTFGDVMSLMANVQSAHFFVVALALAGRRSETLRMRRDCVTYSRNGRLYANGRTFKLVSQLDGQPRDWLLPDLAAQAIEQQVRLVTLCETIGFIQPKPESSDDKTGSRANHLWGSIGVGSQADRTRRLLCFDSAITTFATSIGLETQPGGQNLRHHRFRKTIARLVGLALTQAPKILMRVFGHTSIEMTLYYILTDNALRIEIEKVSRELRVMRAKEVIETMLEKEDSYGRAVSLGGYGGPAAVSIKAAIEEQKSHVHRRGETWGAESVMELAEILTLNGKAWDVVREGVICTKFSGTESGPCNASKGRPEPSRCQSKCHHRLEERFLKDDVDGALKECVLGYETSEKEGNPLMESLWAGQIRMHIDRFPDVRRKWMRNATVKRVVSLKIET